MIDLKLDDFIYIKNGAIESKDLILQKLLKDLQNATLKRDYYESETKRLIQEIAIFK